MHLHIFFLEPEWTETAKKLNITNVFPTPGTAFVIHLEGKDTVYLVANLDRCSLEIAFSQLVHETVHVWQSVRAYTGETHPGSETEAYFIQNTSYDLYQHFKKHRKHVLVLRKSAARERGALHPKLLPGEEQLRKPEGVLQGDTGGW